MKLSITLILAIAIVLSLSASNVKAEPSASVSLRGSMIEDEVGAGEELDTDPSNCPTISNMQQCRFKGCKVCADFPGGPLRCGKPTDMSPHCSGNNIVPNRPVCTAIKNMQNCRNRSDCKVCKDSQNTPERCSNTADVSAGCRANKNPTPPNVSQL